MPSHLVTIGGQPYDALVSGGFGFVTYRTGLAVMDTTKFAPQVIYRISLPTANGEALTPDRKHLLVSSGTGAAVYRVSAPKHRLPAFVGQLSSPVGRYAVGVALSPDGRFAL